MVKADEIDAAAWRTRGPSKNSSCTTESMAGLDLGQKRQDKKACIRCLDGGDRELITFPGKCLSVSALCVRIRIAKHDSGLIDSF